MLVCSDTSHQLLRTSLWANLVDTSTGLLLFMLSTVPKPVLHYGECPSENKEAYHALCLSACQMRHMCPSTHLATFTNVSCLSIYQWLCHSICLILGLFCLYFVCIYFSYHITKVTIMLLGGLEIFLQEGLLC